MRHATQCCLVRALRRKHLAAISKRFYEASITEVAVPFRSLEYAQLGPLNHCFHMADTAAYNLGDICNLLFNPVTSSATESKKKKASKSSTITSNPFAVFANASQSPFAEAARAQVTVAAQLHAQAKRRSASRDHHAQSADAKPEKRSKSAATPGDEPSDPANLKNQDKKKPSSAAAVAVASAAAAQASNASSASPAHLHRHSASENNSDDVALPTQSSTGKVPMNGVVNGIVYKDGKRVTNPHVTPRRPPGERVTDADKDARTVFVGNVPVAIKLKHIKQHFAVCGAVESVRLRSLPVASPKLSRKGAYATKDFREGASSCNAYVVFEDAASIPAALKLNGSELKGHHVRVDTVGGSARAQKFNNRLSLFIGNLDYRVNEEALHTHFSAVGGEGVVAVRCIRDKATSFGKGFAYVHFSTVDALSAALKLDGKLFEGRPLRVSRSDGKASLKRTHSTEVPQKRPATPPSSHPAAAAHPTAAAHTTAAAVGDGAKRLKKPRHVPRPGATQPTLPPSSAPSSRPVNNAPVPNIRGGKKVSL